MPDKFLIADIGGTNARFAISVTDGSGSISDFECRQTLQCKDYETIESAIESYLREHENPAINGICFAAAGPIINNSVKFTNNHWIVKSEALSQRFDTEKVKLLNDWESIAYSLPDLKTSDLLPIGEDWQPLESMNKVLGALGPGSGLGVGGICIRDGNQFPLTTEGGHAGFAPESPLQIEILKALQTKFTRVSNERLLSGPGLVNIYQALCEIDGVAGEELTAADIATSGANLGNDLTAKTMDVFFEVLGQAAGDLALTLGANGIFIVGGICQRYPKNLVTSQFRRGFENKGRHSQILKETPCWLILHKDPGLLGASVYAQAHLQ